MMELLEVRFGVVKSPHIVRFQTLSKVSVLDSQPQVISELWANQPDVPRKS